MISVERIQETVYVFRLSERAMDEACDDASALQSQLRAARAAYALTVPVNGNGAHAPATEPAKKSRAYTKRGGAKHRTPKAKKVRLPCPHCDLSFARQGNLDNHVKFSHPTEADL